MKNPAIPQEHAGPPATLAGSPASSATGGSAVLSSSSPLPSAPPDARLPPTPPLAAAEPRRECVHWWIVESANGPSSWGTCKLCDARRLFYNSAPTERRPTGPNAIEAVHRQTWPKARRKEE